MNLLKYGGQKTAKAKEIKARFSQLLIDIRWFEGRTDMQKLLNAVEKFIKDYDKSLVVLGSDISSAPYYEDENVYEYCANCETEVHIPSDRESKCPECGSRILPCSVCHECISDCPFEKKE